MKRFFFILALILVVLTATSQKAMTFQESEKSGVSIVKLDNLYTSGLHSDSTKAVFWNSEDEFMGAYRKTLQDLSQYLHDHKFVWGKETRCFNRIYFNKTGRVDYFLYNFNTKEVTKEKQKKFEILLNEFIKKYQFPLTAPVNFAQCSPVRYND